MLKEQETSPMYSSLATDPMFREMVELFVEEMPGRMARFRECFNARDWDALRRSAHQMKGSAGSYGFDQFTPFAAHLEGVLSRRPTVDEIAESLEALLAGCAAVSEEPP